MSCFCRLRISGAELVRRGRGDRTSTTHFNRRECGDMADASRESGRPGRGGKAGADDGRVVREALEVGGKRTDGRQGHRRRAGALRAPRVRRDGGGGGARVCWRTPRAAARGQRDPGDRGDGRRLRRRGGAASGQPDRRASRRVRSRATDRSNAHARGPRRSRRWCAGRAGDERGTRHRPPRHRADAARITSGSTTRWP